MPGRSENQPSQHRRHALPRRERCGPQERNLPAPTTQGERLACITRLFPDGNIVAHGDGGRQDSLCLYGPALQQLQHVQQLPMSACTWADFFFSIFLFWRRLDSPGVSRVARHELKQSFIFIFIFIFILLFFFLPTNPKQKG